MSKTITKVIECPNPRCPSRTLNPLGFQVIFKKFQNQYMVLCPHCGNPIHHSERWNFEFIDRTDYQAQYKRTPYGIKSEKESHKRYQQSPKGKAVMERKRKKYRKTDKGKATWDRYYHKNHPNARYYKPKASRT